MQIPPVVLAVAIAGMATTLIVLPKSRRTAYAIYALLAVYVMAQLIDPALLAGVRVPTLDNAALISLMPVALITGLLVTIILVIGGERDAKK